MKSLRIALGIPPACAAFLAGALALSALIGTGCEGTSSGVDNPGMGELTVSFRGAEGAAVRVTGELDVFAKDQNPALYPEPLATVRIRNSAFTNLTGEDFQRIFSAGKAAAAGKRAAGPEAAPVDTATDFNLVFRSDLKTGSLAFGLRYDPDARTFSRDGAVLARLELEPLRLVRYEARLQRLAAVHGDVGRVFIPGTPFQATLSDSGFAFEALPPGTFDLRYMGGDGRIFVVRERLDSQGSTVLTADSVPVGRIDTSDSPNKPVRFEVETRGPSEAFVGMVTVLDGRISAVDTADKRLGILWRVLRDQSPDTVAILLPHSLQTQAQFRKVGVYALELAVTLGATVARDTLFVPVREAPPPPISRLISPSAGESLFVDVQHKVAWEAAHRGLVSVQLSTQGGKEGWRTIGDSLPSLPGLNHFAWTPPESLADSLTCSIRIMQSGRDSLVAGMEGTFSILSRTAPAKDTAR